MPELPEVEYYRRLAHPRTLNRRIVSIAAEDQWFLKGGTTADELRQALTGERFITTDRIGKLLLFEVSSGDVLGLRFGMSGRLVVDDDRAVDDWKYSSSRLLPEWNRFSLTFDDGGVMAVNDPRRLGGVQLNPSLVKLGPDALKATLSDLRAMMKSQAPVKAWLLDQSKVAGVGNLLADEMLWRAGIDPARPAASLDEREVKRLHRHLRTTVLDLLERGGSHTGDLSPGRIREGVCPRDGTPLLRRNVGGRTSYSCPRHQR